MCHLLLFFLLGSAGIGIALEIHNVVRHKPILRHVRSIPQDEY